MHTMWKQNYTLGGKEKLFLWLYDGEKITIRRRIKNNFQLEDTFSNCQIDMLMSYIKQNGRVALANSVTKIKDGTEKEGIGKFIYNNIFNNIEAAQTASQLVSIFYNANVLYYNGRKKNMVFWINNFNWKEAILNYMKQTNSTCI